MFEEQPWPWSWWAGLYNEDSLCTAASPVIGKICCASLQENVSMTGSSRNTPSRSAQRGRHWQRREGARHELLGAWGHLSLMPSSNWTDIHTPSKVFNWASILDMHYEFLDNSQHYIMWRSIFFMLTSSLHGVSLRRYWQNQYKLDGLGRVDNRTSDG